jgi:hypothetical protein
MCDVLSVTVPQRLEASPIRMGPAVCIAVTTPSATQSPRSKLAKS